MVKKDFHMHPNLLKKPEQAPYFIDRAIELGFDEICFTDHMPFSVTGDEHDRIPFGRVGDYCAAVRALANQYQKEITIRCGIEIDYHPACCQEIEQVLAAGDFDYIIGSSHFDIKGFGVVFDRTTRREYARLVFENYLSAIDSGYFHTISHLDVFRRLFGNSKNYPLIDDNYTYSVYEDLITRILERLEATGVCLEINASPLYLQFDSLGPYPERNILDMAKKYRIQYVYGSDAHASTCVGYGYDTLAAYFE